MAPVRRRNHHSQNRRPAPHPPRMRPPCRCGGTRSYQWRQTDRGPPPAQGGPHGPYRPRPRRSGPGPASPPDWKVRSAPPGLCRRPTRRLRAAVAGPASRAERPRRRAGRSGRGRPGGGTVARGLRCLRARGKRPGAGGILGLASRLRLSEAWQASDSLSGNERPPATSVVSAREATGQARARRARHPGPRATVR